MKRTKIVATIGPASESRNMMEKLISAGMNVARLNFSHGTYSNHQILIRNLRSASKIAKTTVAIMQDLQGPRIRIGEVSKDGVKVVKKNIVILVTENFTIPNKTTDIYIPIQYPTLYQEIKAGHSVLIDDANIELEVIKILIILFIFNLNSLLSHRSVQLTGQVAKCLPL